MSLRAKLNGNGRKVDLTCCALFGRTAGFVSFVVMFTVNDTSNVWDGYTLFCGGDVFDVRLPSLGAGIADEGVSFQPENDDAVSSFVVDKL